MDLSKNPDVYKSPYYQYLMLAAGIPIIPQPDEGEPESAQSESLRPVVSAPISANSGDQSRSDKQLAAHQNVFDAEDTQTQAPHSEGVPPSTSAPLQELSRHTIDSHKLRYGVYFSMFISRGLLTDIFRGKCAPLLPPAAVPIIGNILNVNPEAPFTPIDFNERETGLQFWHMNHDGTNSLLTDWKELLTLVPHLVYLVPADIRREYKKVVSRGLIG